jgi:outer membrane protein assembly factor BamD
MMEFLMKVLIAIAGCVCLLACGKPPAEESFGAAEQTQRSAEAKLGTDDAAQDSLFRIAIEQYEQVVEDHPEHPLAKVALFRVAELHNNGTRDFPKAIEANRRYLSMYPGTPQAALSLFMMGFVYNNELGNYDSAAAAYRRFIQHYPDHELVASARAELETMGKTPEEIIALQLEKAQQEESGEKSSGAVKGGK